MSKLSKISALLILFMSAIVFMGCNSAQKQNNENETETEISDELIEKQNELKGLANEELSNINDKVRELNSRLEDGAELSEHQQELLDAIQKKRADVNDRLSRIEQVSEEDWEEFRTNFEEDLESIKTRLDEVLEEF